MEIAKLCVLVIIEIVVSGGMSMPQILSTLEPSNIQVDRTGACWSWKWTDLCSYLLCLSHQNGRVVCFSWFSCGAASDGTLCTQCSEEYCSFGVWDWYVGCLAVEFASSWRTEYSTSHLYVFSCTEIDQGIWIGNLGLWTLVWDSRSWAYWNFSPFHYPFCYPYGCKEYWFSCPPGYVWMSVEWWNGVRTSLLVSARYLCYYYVFVFAFPHFVLFCFFFPSS